MRDIDPQEPDPALAALREIAGRAGSEFGEAKRTWPDYVTSTRAFIRPVLKGVLWAAFFVLVVGGEVSRRRSAE